MRLQFLRHLHAMQRSVHRLRRLLVLLVCGRTFICTPTFDATLDEGVQVEHLTALKEELRTTLQRMEAHEKAVQERQKPQSIEQIDEAEKKLSEAFEELKQRRAELQKRSQGGGP